MTNMRNSANVAIDGGSEIANAVEILLCSTTGEYSIVDSPFTLPVIQSSEINDTEEDKYLISESGAKYLVAGGEKTVSFKANFMQQDFDTLTMYKEFKNKSFAIIKERFNQAVGGYHSYVIFPNTKISSTFTASAPSGVTEITFNATPTTGLLTLDLTGMDEGMAATLTCASLIVPTGATSIWYKEAEV